MYYNKIYQFIKDLNSDNIDEYKPQDMYKKIIQTKTSLVVVLENHTINK